MFIILYVLNGVCDSRLSSFAPTHTYTHTPTLTHTYTKKSHQRDKQIFRKPLKHKTLFTQFQPHTVFQPISDTKCKHMRTLNGVPTTSKLVRYQTYVYSAKCGFLHSLVTACGTIIPSRICNCAQARICFSFFH